MKPQSKKLADKRKGEGREELVPISPAKKKSATRIDQINSGPPMPPIVRIRTFSPEDWEEFIEEWASSLDDQYFQVYRSSGAGDKGRDIVAHTAEPSQGKEWDNYQCKHYDHRLEPNEIWVELGKVIYHTMKKEFSIPRRYFFVAPQDVGTTLSRLLEKPGDLKQGLIDNWEKKCQRNICKDEVPLSGELYKYLQTFPFEIFSFQPILTVIMQHSKTPWHIHRFGGGLPQRPKSDEPPSELRPHEMKYTNELFKAYSDHQGDKVSESCLIEHPNLKKHFVLSRASFYSAESLKSFSRDHLPEREYERLQDQIDNGIQETCLSNHESGFQKVLEVTKAAVNLPITDHALLPVLQSPDRRGICHQLVELNRLKWIEDE